MDPSSTAPGPEGAAPTPKRRRRLFGWLIKGPLGCGAFLVGLLATLVLLTPWAASKFVPRLVEDEFSNDIEGEIEVRDLDLAWFSRQSGEAELYGVQGNSVARVDWTMPALSSLAAAGWRGFGRNTVSFDLNLVTGADGRTNLQRALEPAGGGKAEVNVQIGGRDRDPRSSSAADSLRDALQFQGLLDLTNSRIAWRDEREPGEPQVVRIEGVTGRLRVESGYDVLLELHGEQIEPERGPLDLRINLGGFDELHRGAAPRPLVKATAEELPIGLFDALGGFEGALVEALGQTLDVHLNDGDRAEGQSERDPGTWALQLNSERLDLAAEFERLEDGLRGLSGSQFVWRPTPRALERLWSGALPQDWSIVPVEGRGDGPQLTASLQEFELRWDEDLFELGGEEPWGEHVERIDLGLRADFPSLLVGGPGLNEAGVEGPLELFGAELELRHDDEGVQLSWEAALRSAVGGGERPAELRGVLRAATLAELLAAEGQGRLPEFSAETSLDDLPSDWLGGLSGVGGWLTQLLGERIGRVELQAERLVGTDSGELSLALFSDRAEAHLAGHLEGGRLVSGAPADGAMPDGPRPEALSDRPGSLEFELDQPSIEALVRELLPMLADFAEVGGNRAGLQLERFALPLDGDLSQLSAALALDLGELRIGFVPGLSALLGGGGLPKLRGGDSPAGLEPSSSIGARRSWVQRAPLRLSIDAGVVRYSGLSFDIDGVALDFYGSFDLASGQLDLETALPLQQLRGEAGDLLRPYLGQLGGLALPVRLGGSRGSVEVAPDFPALFESPQVRKVLGDRAGGLLEELVERELGASLEAWDEELREALEQVDGANELLEGLGLDGLDLGNLPLGGLDLDLDLNGVELDEIDLGDWLKGLRRTEDER